MNTQPAGPGSSWNLAGVPGPDVALASPVVADAVRLLSRRRRVSRAARWLFAVNAIPGGAVASSWSSIRDDGPAAAVFVGPGVVLAGAMVTAFVGWARCDKAVARLAPDVRDVAEAVVRFQGGQKFPVKFTAFATTLAALVLAAFFFGAPMAVNGAAYLLRAGQAVTFTPESYNYACDDKGDCAKVTQGTLGDGGSPTAYTWPHAVALHHPFPVQLTFIRWPTAPRVYDDGDARTNLIAGLVFVASGALLSLLVWRRMRRLARLGRW